MTKLLSQIIGSAFGVWAAALFVPGVAVKIYADSNFFGIQLTALWQVYLILGIVLGLLNFFVKPVLKTLALPLELITLGLFGIVINMAIIWAVDIIFKELTVPLFIPLFWTSLLVWVLNFIISKILVKNGD